MQPQLILFSTAIACAALSGAVVVFRILVVEFALLDVRERLEDNAPRPARARRS